MSCIAPARARGGHEFPCHKCIGCRRDNRLLRQTAIESEALCWPVGLFVTLTFKPEALPTSAGAVDAAARWFRHQAPFRAVVVFERGSLTERAHLHAVCFGSDEPSMLAWCERWRERFGHVDVEPFAPSHAGYVAKYLSKSARSARFEVEHSDGLGPERAYWPRSPACGANAAKRFAQVVASSVDLRVQFSAFADVPKVFKVFGSPRVIPDRIRAAMRELFSLPRTDPARSDIQKQIAEIRRSDPLARRRELERRRALYDKLRRDEVCQLTRRFGISRMAIEAERDRAAALAVVVPESEFPASLGEVPVVKRGRRA